MIPIKLAPSGDNAAQTLAGNAGRVNSQPAEGRDLAAGFAAMLRGALPGSTAAGDAAGEALPVDGKDLPLIEGELPAELPVVDLALAPASDDSAGPAALPLATETGKDSAAVMAAVPLVEPPAADTPPVRPSGDPAGISPPLPALAEATRAALGQREPVTARPAIVAAAVETVAAVDESILPVVPPMAAGLPRPPQAVSRTADAAASGIAPTTPLPTASQRDLPPVAATTLAPALQEVRAGNNVVVPPVERRAEPVDSILRPLLAPTTASTAPAAATPPPMPPSIELPVGSQRWSDAIGERVLWMSAQKLQSAEIRLNPAELGPLKIEVTLDDGNAQVNFTAQHALTRDALEQALPRLRDMFSGEGLNLASADVSEQGVRQGRDEQRGGSSGSELAGQGDDDLPASGEAPLARVSQGLVDTFV